MKETNNTEKENVKPVLPFFLVLALISLVCAIIPLRPTVSYEEKRELAKFPEFSPEAFVSGSYFKEMDLWFSDTFPGREQWLQLSQSLSSLHGYGDLAIEGQLPDPEEIPEIPAPTKSAATEAVEEETVPPEDTPLSEESLPEETEEPVPSDDGQPETGDDVLLDATFSSTSVVQFNGSAYQPLGFSQQHSNWYIKSVNAFAAMAEPMGVRVVSAPPPIAIGTMIDAKYLPKLRSADPVKTLSYMHESMDSGIITVDTQGALIPHRDEYLFFHSDHHWTALAAYYCYRATCEAMGLYPADLEDFEVLDQGPFKGTLAGRVTYPRKLTPDNVISYIPPGEVTLTVYGNNGSTREGKVIRDMRNDKIGSKYLCFLESDQPLVCMTNHSLPGDAGNLLVLKDSFGNCFVPFFSQNYRNVYAIDYRKFGQTPLKNLLETYDIQDVIFAPNLMSTQSDAGMRALGSQCGLHFK